VAIGEQIQPLNSSGNPDPVDGKIVLVSIGMSNTRQEFEAFEILAAEDAAINPQMVFVNGSGGGLSSTRWADPNDVAWSDLEEKLENMNVTSQQVQIVWIKLAQTGAGGFPEKAEALQADLEIVVRLLKARYPSTKIAYFSSRTRAYAYSSGVSPESTAFETGFSVRWLIEKQINGDPDLNYDPANGPVVAPYMSWGPYLWIDGQNPRSDGRIWEQQDLEADCIHPSFRGEQKVAVQLREFFGSDSTSVNWFLIGDLCQDQQRYAGTGHNASGDAARSCVYLPYLD
jgi:hypothetical protein